MFQSFFGFGGGARPLNLSDLIVSTEHKNECVCFICFDIMTQPQQLMCCQKRMCLSCLQKTINRKNQCPACRSRNIQFNRCRLTELLIGNLQMKCEYSHNRSRDEACPLVIRYRERESHKRSCPYRHIMCQYCHKKILAKDLASHQNQCGAQVCNMCSQRIPRNRFRTHQHVCPERPITCSASSEGCLERFPYSQKSRHEHKCPYVKIKQLKQEIEQLKQKPREPSFERLMMMQNFNTPANSKNKRMNKTGVYRILLSVEVRSESSKRHGIRVGSLKKDSLVNVTDLRCRRGAIYGRISSGWICIQNADRKRYAQYFATPVSLEEISLPERFTTPLGVRALSLSPTPTPCRSVKRKRRESIDDMCNDLRSFLLLRSKRRRENHLLPSSANFSSALEFSPIDWSAF